MKKIEKVIDKLSEKLIKIDKSKNLIEAAKIMKDFNVGTLLVVENEKMIGILSERDIVRRAIALDKSVSETKVEDIMTKNVLTASVQDTLSDCINKMVQQKCRHLPIMERQQIIGMVSVSDLLMLLNEEYKEERDILADYVCGVYVKV